MLGPAWSSHDLEIRAGRFPLSVEGHLMNMTARLVPGATTVTTGARYYSLHGYVAHEAEQRGLDGAAALELLRRCEVVVAAVSETHPAPSLPAPHGAGVVGNWLRRDGYVDLTGLSTPKSGYAQPERGFLGPYLGSEITMGILDGQLTPGQRYDHDAVAPGFEGLLDLAAEPRLGSSELSSAAHLAVGAAAQQPDGRGFARLLTGQSDPVDRADVVRRNTIRILARSLLLSDTRRPVDAVRSVVAYGEHARADPVLSQIPEVNPWRGVLYRHESVGAWRRLWAEMVDEITGSVPRSHIVDFVADSLGAGSLQSFLDQLPATLDGLGNPAPAELEVRSQGLNTPFESLALLAIGAQRANEVEGTVRSAFVGDEKRLVVLSPLWVQQWIDDRRGWALADIAADLVDVMFSRARRIAMRKMRINEDGHVWLPTVIREEGGLLSKTSSEGRDNVGLRLDQLHGILLALGIVSGHSEAALTELGQELLDVRQ